MSHRRNEPPWPPALIGFFRGERVVVGAAGKVPHWSPEDERNLRERVARIAAQEQAKRGMDK